MVWLFALPMLALTLADSPANIFIFLCELYLCVRFLWDRRGMSFKDCLKTFHPVALFCAAVLVYVFHATWIASGRLAGWLPGIAALACGVCAVPGISILCRQIAKNAQEQSLCAAAPEAGRKRRWGMAWLFELPLFVLLVSDTAENGLLLAAALLLCVKFLRGTQKPTFWAYLKSFHLVALLTAFGLAFVFYTNWIASGKLGMVADLLHLTKEVLLGLIAGGLAICAVPGLSILCNQLQRFYQENRSASQPLPGDGKLSTGHKLWLLVFSAALVTVCSKSSPLYPFNDWVDPNCFITVGKSMLSGLVPYRDLMEQKGPVVYYLHALTSLISYRTFFGVWLVEVAACFGFACYAAKTVGLFTRLDRVSLGCLSILMTAAYSTASFAQGDSVEELSLCFLAYANFVGLRAMKQDNIPEYREFFFIGVTSGCILWAKYSLLGFYIGWIVVPFLICVRKGEFVRFLKAIGAVIAGVALVTVPVLSYFVWQGAMGDLFKSYFYDNITGYTVSGTTYEHLMAISLDLFVPCLYVLLMAGILWAGAVKQKNVLWNQVLCYVVQFVMMYAGGKDYGYYAFILWFIIPFGAIAMTEVSRGFVGKWAESPVLKKAAPALCLAVCLTFAYLVSPNTYLMKYEKEDMPQFRAKQIIEQYHLDHEPTLLNYGYLDGGYYTVLGIVPSCRYFCWLNIDSPEIWEAQDKCLMEQQVDFVVTRDMDIPEDAPYTLIDSYSFLFSGVNRTYNLYYRN